MELRDAPLPSPHDESWRKVDLGGFDPRTLKLTEAAVQPPPASELHACSLLTLAEADGSMQQIVAERQQMKRRQARDAIALARALAPSTPLILSAAPGAQAAATLRFRPTAGALFAPQIYVFVGAGAELTLILECESQGEETVYLPQLELHVAKGGRLKAALAVAHAGGDRRFGWLESFLAEDASVHLATAFDGGRLAKDFLIGRLQGRGAVFRAVGALALGGRDFCDVEMIADHQADDTQSSLHYKTVLRERAHSIFDGNLIIPPGRQRVRSHQLNNNILLDRSARAESMPRLVIQAERVQAEHGATVGQLDHDALFYLMARGLSEAEARVLLVHGFLEQLLAEFPSAELAEKILSRFYRRLSL